MNDNFRYSPSPVFILLQNNKLSYRWWRSSILWTIDANALCRATCIIFSSGLWVRAVDLSVADTRVWAFRCCPVSFSTLDIQLGKGQSLTFSLFCLCRNASLSLGSIEVLLPVHCCVCSFGMPPSSFQMGRSLMMSQGGCSRGDLPYLSVLRLSSRPARWCLVARSVGHRERSLPFHFPFFIFLHRWWVRFFVWNLICIRNWFPPPLCTLRRRPPSNLSLFYPSSSSSLIVVGDGEWFEEYHY